MKFSPDTQQLILQQVENVFADMDVQYGIELRKIKFIDDVCYVWVDMMESAGTTIHGRHATHLVMTDYVVEKVQAVLDTISLICRTSIIPWKLQVSVHRGVFLTYSADQMVKQLQNAGNHSSAWTDERGDLVVNP